MIDKPTAPEPTAVLTVVSARTSPCLQIELQFTRGFASAPKSRQAELRPAVLKASSDSPIAVFNHRSFD